MLVRLWQARLQASLLWLTTCKRLNPVPGKSGYLCKIDAPILRDFAHLEALSMKVAYFAPNHQRRVRRLSVAHHCLRFAIVGNRVPVLITLHGDLRPFPVPSFSLEFRTEGEGGFCPQRTPRPGESRVTVVSSLSGILYL